MEITVSDAKRILADFDTPDSLAYELAKHDSAVVRQSAERFLRDKAKELRRLREMSRYEEEARARGAVVVAGLDEVGRGPLSGPVVVAAVVLPPGCLLWGVDDSKKLSEAKRLKLAPLIKAKADAWAVAGVNHRGIDEYNITQATYMAAKKALARLPYDPEHLLLDAITIPGCAFRQTAIVKGDSLSLSIAAASILAKNHRDGIMLKFAALYPGYAWEKNKGYPTKEHFAAIARLGLCPIHRKTFVGGKTP